MRNVLKILTLVAVVSGGVRAALSGTPRASLQQHPITWSLARHDEPITQGKTFRVLLHAVIPDGWHIYSTSQPPGGPITTTLRVDDTNFVIAGQANVRDPDVAPDGYFLQPDGTSLVTETYVDSVTFSVPMIARVANVSPLRLVVHYQTCTNRVCMPPRDDLLELPVHVAAAASGTPVIPAAAAPSPPAAPAGLPSTTAAAAPKAVVPVVPPSQSLAAFLLLALLMGALSLLTPCVFPMIPITVSYFTRSNETSRARPARNALVYALGIVATFTILGMGVAVLVGAGGINRFAANPWINLLVTAIFVAFALNLFGLYQLGFPAALVSRLDGATRRSGGSETVGILLMGLTFTLTSFTCTTPFVGSVLVMAAQGSWIWPLLGLLAFSAVFALPFFVLALMPSAVAKLPRSGVWLQDVKVVMGFVELATAMKFLSNADLVLRWGVFTRGVVLAIWLVIAVLAALYIVGLLGRRESSVRPGVARIAGAVVMVVLALYLARGLSGRRMGELESFLPPPEGGITEGNTSVRGELSWMVNGYEAGLALARAQHRPVLVDFTGYTCTNCRWMEANMFPREAVAQQLSRFVRVRLYTDGQGEIYQRQQQMEQDKLGTVALPYYMIVDSLGTVQAQFLGMTRSTDEFVQFLRDGRSVTAP